MRTTIEKQPSVIPVFFGAEMWERFGFYVIQALLVLYMTSNVFNFPDDRAYAILSAFTAIAYITPILGGYVASHILDYEHAVTLGGILLAFGYAGLALPDQNLFYISLAIVAVGNGFFKPNISSYLGSFYQQHDPFREKGYTIFYVGINVGVLLSTAGSGYIQRYFGWHVPFLLASISLLVGTAIFVIGMHYLKSVNNFHRVRASIASKKTLQIIAVYIGAVLLTGLSYEIIRHRNFANELMLWGGIATFVALIIYAFRYNEVTRHRMLACIFLVIISVIFWAIYFQMFLSMNLFIERAVDRHLFGFVLPSPLFLSLESIFIIIFGPIAATIWLRLAKKNRNPSIPMKFALSMFAIFVAFIIVYAGTHILNVHHQSDKIFVAISYWFVMVGELLLSPVGLAMVTVLVPQELVGLMMGVWFVSLGLGFKLAGVIAELAAIPKHIHSVIEMNHIYGHAFLMYAMLSLGVAVVCLACVPLLKRMIDAKA